MIRTWISVEFPNHQSWHTEDFCHLSGMTSHRLALRLTPGSLYVPRLTNVHKDHNPTMPMPRMPTCLVIYVGTSAFGRKGPVEKKAKPKPRSDHGIWCKIWQWLTKPWETLRSSCFQSQEMILRVLTSSRSVKTNVLIMNNKKPCKFGLTITKFLRIWVAADVKYLDVAYPAYVEHEKAKHTSHGITHRVSTIAHARHNWTLKWHGAIFLDKKCQVNSIAFSCFQAFTCPSPKNCRKSVDIISISEVVSEICCQKRHPWSTISRASF